MTKTKVAIQGQPASFHEVAAHHHFGDAIELVYCDLPFETVFQAVKEGRAEYGVCAVRNSSYGSIREVRALLEDYNAQLITELALPIEQCLIGLPSASKESITEVYSHPVAISQCSQYLAHELPSARRIASDDTAGSVADIARWGAVQKAAIASEAAAKLHGMTVLAKGIQNDKNNTTCFAVFTLSKSRVFV